MTPGASRKQWPWQMGFDRYYGFIGGETSQWYPDIRSLPVKNKGELPVIPVDERANEVPAIKAG